MTDQEARQRIQAFVDGGSLKELVVWYAENMWEPQPHWSPWLKSAYGDISIVYSEYTNKDITLTTARRILAETLELT